MWRTGSTCGMIITIAMLHLVNNMAIPVSILGSDLGAGHLGRAGCHDPVVVWPQRRGLLPDRGLPGHDVLLCAEAGRTPRLQLQAVDHPLLGLDLPLHLGRSAPPALYRPAELGLDPGHGVLGHPVDALVGWHDQRPDDAVGRLGQAAHRSGHPDDGGVDRLLRHVDLRRPDDVDQGRSTACRTTPTGPSVTSIPARLAGTA
jgi:hypothetical protein